MLHKQKHIQSCMLLVWKPVTPINLLYIENSLTDKKVMQVKRINMKSRPKTCMLSVLQCILPFFMF